MFKRQFKSYRGTISSPDDLYKNLLEYSFKLLTRRSYSIQEISDKLQKRAFLVMDPTLDGEPAQKLSEDTIPKIVQRLLDYKYLNDQDFAKLFIQDQLVRKPQGIRLLKEKLKSKGIGKAMVEEVIENINLDEMAQALSALEKKKKSLKGVHPQKIKEKLFRFLISRGFDTGVILKILK